MKFSLGLYQIASGKASHEVGSGEVPPFAVCAQGNRIGQRADFGRGNCHDVADMVRESAPGRIAVLDGRERRSAKQRQPIRVRMVFVQCLPGQIQKVAADFRHVAPFLESEAVRTFNQHVYFHLPQRADVETRVEKSDERPQRA